MTSQGVRTSRELFDKCRLSSSMRPDDNQFCFIEAFGISILDLPEITAYPFGAFYRGVT